MEEKLSFLGRTQFLRKKLRKNLVFTEELQNTFGKNRVYLPYSFHSVFTELY